MHATVKAICRYLGLLLLLSGALGLRYPHLLGLHMTMRQDVAYVISGLLSVYFGWVDTLGSAYAFARLAAVAYLSLAVLGFATPRVVSRLMDKPSLSAREGEADNMLHAAVGSLFLIGAVSRPLAVRRQVSPHVRRGAASSVDR